MINVTHHRQQIGLLRGSLVKMKVDLEVGRRDNEQLEIIESKLQKVNELVPRVEGYIKYLEKIKRMTIEEDAAFKKRRLAEISVEITNSLGIIFPVESFRAVLDCEFKHRNQRAELTLYHKNGTERIPDVSEGMLLQQLISYSSSMGLSWNMGANKAFTDEVFSAAYKENLSKLADIMRFYLEAGMQILMIEQSEEGYKDLPRREFRIVKDPVSEEVILESTLDY